MDILTLQISKEYTNEVAQEKANLIEGKVPLAELPVDDALSDDSENPVQNKVITEELGNIMEAAEGKTASFVVDDTVDTEFDSNNNTITLTGSFTDINKGTIQLGDLAIGDVIYVTQTDVPDRWVQTITKSDDVVTSVTLGKMETAKVPVLDVQVNGTSVVNNGVANIQTDIMNTISDTGSVSQTLNPNEFYNFTGTLTDLTITFGTAATGKTNEYKGQFISGSIAPTVTFPNGINWIGGSFPTLEANTLYQFSVLNSVGVIVGVAVV